MMSVKGCEKLTKKMTKREEGKKRDRNKLCAKKKSKEREKNDFHLLRCGDELRRTSKYRAAAF